MKTKNRKKLNSKRGAIHQTKRKPIHSKYRKKRFPRKTRKRSKRKVARDMRRKYKGGCGGCGGCDSPFGNPLTLEGGTPPAQCPPAQHTPQHTPPQHTLGDYPPKRCEGCKREINGGMYFAHDKVFCSEKCRCKMFPSVFQILKPGESTIR